MQIRFVLDTQHTLFVIIDGIVIAHYSRENDFANLQFGAKTLAQLLVGAFVAQGTPAHTISVQAIQTHALRDERLLPLAKLRDFLAQDPELKQLNNPNPLAPYGRWHEMSLKELGTVTLLGDKPLAMQN